MLEEVGVDRKEGGMTGDRRSGLLGVLYGLLEGAGDYESHIRDAERAFDR